MIKFQKNKPGHFQARGVYDGLIIGNLAILIPQRDGRPNGFASPSFDEFAISDVV